MKKLFLVFAIFSLIECKTTSPKINDAIIEENPIRYSKPTCEIIFQSETNGNPEKKNDLMTTNEEFTNLVVSLNISPENYEKLLNVDFDTQNIIVYYYGKIKSQRIKATLLNSKINDKTIDVNLNPIIENLNNLEENMPYLIIQVPKNKAVNFTNEAIK